MFERFQRMVVCGLGWAVVLGAAWCSAAPAHADPPNWVVVFVDDMGWTDMGCQGVVDDIKTPHLDDLARRGARLTSGYITAPQCSPSRAGLLTGRYQQRFDFDHIGMCPLPLSETVISERVKQAGYATGMVGKWHLSPHRLAHRWAEREGLDLPTNEQGWLLVPEQHMVPYRPDQRGFDDVFEGEINHYWHNFGLNGESIQNPQRSPIEGYRLDLQTDAAIQFIRRNQDDPFYLHLAYFAPHVPLEATPRYLARFPGEMPERRRYALAMLSAIDDGIGRIVAELRRLGLEEDTVIVFTSDNGAPIKVHKEDRTLEWKGGGWDGSINDPLNGEKGTLLEGGIRVPMIWCWPGTIQPGQVVDTPMIALDIAASMVANCGNRDVSAAGLDGVDLIPFLSGKSKAPDRMLFWRFWTQAAVRDGDWKLFTLGTGERYLFNLAHDKEETTNLVDQHPAIAKRLEQALAEWAQQLVPAGIPHGELDGQEKVWFKAYLDWEAPTD